jgi:CheY-like chemotaxis protein
MPVDGTAAAALSPTLLLVEDNLADQEMTRRALARADAGIQLQIVNDGEEALDYLLRRDIYSTGSHPTPDVVLIDLNLPKISGKDLIRQVRASEAIRHVPLIVLSTSQAEEDVLESYRLGCNSYLIKPSRFDQFVGTMEHVIRYWLRAVRLPRSS